MRFALIAALGLGIVATSGAVAQIHHRRSAPGYESANPVNRAIRDLQLVYSRAHIDRHEAEHFRRAIDELSEFQRRAARGRFDSGRLDRAIDNIEDLVKADQLHPRQRAMLREDLFELRSFRSYAGRRNDRW